MVSKTNKKLAIEMRRDRVISLISRGFSQREIAKELNVSPTLINNDCKYIHSLARCNLEKYASEILVEEMQLSLVRLKDLIREAWNDISNPNTSKRDKYNAIQIVKDCTALKLEILGSGVLLDEYNKSSNVNVEQKMYRLNNEIKPLSQ